MGPRIFSLQFKIKKKVISSYLTPIFFGCVPNFHARLAVILPLFVAIHSARVRLKIHAIIPQVVQQYVLADIFGQFHPSIMCVLALHPLFCHFPSQPGAILAAERRLIISQMIRHYYISKSKTSLVYTWNTKPACDINIQCTSFSRVGRK